MSLLGGEYCECIVRAPEHLRCVGGGSGVVTAGRDRGGRQCGEDP